MPSNLLAMASNLENDGLQPTSDGLQPRNDGLQATSDSRQPGSAKLRPQTSGAAATCSHISACSRAAPPNSAAELRERLRHEASMMLLRRETEGVSGKGCAKIALITSESSASKHLAQISAKVTQTLQEMCCYRKQAQEWHTNNPDFRKRPAPAIRCPPT